MVVVARSLQLCMLNPQMTDKTSTDNIDCCTKCTGMNQEVRPSECPAVWAGAALLSIDSGKSPTDVERILIAQRQAIGSDIPHEWPREWQSILRLSTKQEDMVVTPLADHRERMCIGSVSACIGMRPWGACMTAHETPTVCDSCFCCRLHAMCTEKSKMPHKHK